ncbi:DUF2529 family protein [Shouchella patagoniensis]|uniref:DUF2529 family protein n=1 Tax=Shouchella patagoniensis TaxID=228576 RepID=UPI000995A219|nr:DUF2529 family protein [Shouchella patagoniensis]
MHKIYTTQLFGLFKNINEKQEDLLEDAGRLLAQAIVMQGTIYVKGFDQLKALEEAATGGYDALPQAEILNQQGLGPEDRLLLFAPDATDDRVTNLLDVCTKTNTPAIVVSSATVFGITELENCDLFLDTGVKDGLIPDDDGNRIGHPGTIVALFIAQHLCLTITDILSELND